MAFLGASLIADGKLCASTASTVADSGADSGYHLLVVQGYSRTKETIPTGEWIESHPFIVGGRRWTVRYSPNGNDSLNQEFMSLALVLLDDIEDKVEVRYVFSCIGQPELRVPKRIRQSKPVHLDGQGDLGGQYKFIKREVFESSRHLKDDTFVIRCDLAVVLNPDTNSTKEISTARLSDLQSHLGDLLLSKDCSDVTFEVGGEEFAAHRCVLAARSTVFRSQFSGAMNESSVVKISGIEADVFRGLLTFIYTDEVPESVEKEADDDHGEMYATRLLQFLEAAERYDLQKLKSVCEEKLADIICADTVSDIIVNELLSKFPVLSL